MTEVCSGISCLDTTSDGRDSVNEVEGGGSLRIEQFASHPAGSYGPARITLHACIVSMCARQRGRSC